MPEISGIIMSSHLIRDFIFVIILCILLYVIIKLIKQGENRKEKEE